MTSHYVDITVVPGPEFSVPHLLGALYDRLHLALVQHGLETIGVSFPGYSLTPRTLGDTLRLHGSASGLQHLLQADWLKGVRDHVRIAPLAPTPGDARHRSVSRKQFKTNAERLRRRRIRRKGETSEQVAQAIPLSVERRPDLPYAHLRSRSTGQPFHLFIALGPLAQDATPGQFNSHGLSGTATIPWF
ncbi:MAG: type I-F CRISPR-associated endoribonuclease Cas6/Csy4 [Xenophilus sp.]